MSGAKFKKPTNTAEEDVLVAELRQLLSPGGSALVDEQLKQGGENGLDALTLRRWAVARKWDIAHAAKDLAAHAVYRSQNILGGRVTQDQVQADLDQKKTFLNGYDNQDNPFILLLCKRHFAHNPEMSAKAIEYTLDAAVRLGELNPAWTGKLSIVFDLAGIGYANFDTASLKKVFELLQNHYPERLARLYLYRAPMIFYALWSLVKPFIDPVTRTKVVFIEEKEAAGLFPKYFHPKVCPLQLGGQGPLRSVEDVWCQLLGKPFCHATSLHAATTLDSEAHKQAPASAGIMLTANGDGATHA